MKTKKQLLRGALLSIATIGLLAVGFTGCKDTDDGERYVASYGEIRGSQNDFDIVRDDGTMLYVDVNQTGGHEVEDGQRVLANYTILGARDGGLAIRLHALYDVLTKNSISQSFLDADFPHRADSVGYDPIVVSDAWFGSKYLNIYFSIQYAVNSNVAHLISLVYDDTRSTDQELFVELRHNDYGEHRATYGWGVVSFDLSDLMPVGKDKIKVTLSWTDYEGYHHSVSGDYSLTSSQSVPSSISETQRMQLSVR